MKLGVFTVLYQKLPFEQALDKLASMGAEAVEIGTGNYPGNAHCRPQELLDDPGAAMRFRKAVEKRGLFISALSQHGNPLHPEAQVARFTGSRRRIASAACWSASRLMRIGINLTGLPAPLRLPP